MDSLRRSATMVALHLPGAYDLATGQWRYILLYAMHRPHENDFCALPLLNLGNSPVLIDVGGNIGQSVLSLYTIFPGAKVLSFEPNPAVFSKLERLTRKFPRLSVFPTGLSAETGEAELFIPSYNGTMLTGLASFDYEDAKGWFSSGSKFLFNSEKLAISSQRVSLIRLDDLGLKPDFIKIDVQGLESQVLAGGLETIRKYRPVIMAEYIQSESDAHKIVKALDYRLMEFDGRILQEVHGKIRRVNQFLIPTERLT